MSAPPPPPPMRLRPPLRRFSRHEDALIIKYSDKLPLSRLAKVLGRSVAGVWKRQQALLRENRARKRWSPEEDELLAEKYGLVRDTALAKRLGRTVVAIRMHARTLGLLRTGNFYTSGEVALIFMVDPTTVRKHWVRKGYLRAKRGPIKRGNQLLLQITQGNLERFIREHPNRYDYRRICPIKYRYWRNIANEVAVAGVVPLLYRDWEAHEDAFLLNNRGQMTYLQMGRQLTRTPEAVGSRLQVLRKRGHLVPPKVRQPRKPPLQLVA